MKTTLRLLVILVTLVLFGSCATLRPVSISQTQSVKEYHFFYITPTAGINSTTGGMYGGVYGFYGATTSHSVNPADLISGYLIKQGFTRLPEVVPELKDQTLVINYGQSGSRKVFWGSVTEITIQFLLASTMQPICICSGEGFGETEADDIKQAINSCLDAIFAK